jgi:HlyD family secretion protein
MRSSFVKEILAHPLVLWAGALTVVLVAGSGWYYYSGTREPSSTPSLAANQNSGVVTMNGTVEPAQNPNLAFVSGGRVAAVRVAVGDEVAAGELLASLDTSVLAAGRAQAAANVDAAQAKLAGMQAGPRAVDVQLKQAALDAANAALASTYATVAASIQSAYDKSFSGVSSASDSLFNQPNSPSPSLVFTTINTQLGLNAQSARVSANNVLATWSTESGALSQNTAPADLDAALTTSLNHVSAVRDYANALLAALNNASPSFSAAQVAAAQAAVGALRDTLNGLISTLQGVQQTITQQKLAVAAAQDALNQTLAGSTPQDIAAQQAVVEAAQASVQNFDAQIANAEIVAPFAGQVSSVQVKVGDIVSPNTTAVTLNPASQLQITAYVSETQVGSLTAGENADVTLDAYGNGRHFAATVISVDRSPTNQAGVPAYRVVLQFNATDPSVSSGMTANVIVNPSH